MSKIGYNSACIVTENCIKCKYMDCVEICPEDAFREGPNFLVIDSDACSGCNRCIDECPAVAICPEDNVPPDQFEFIAINAELSRSWPKITNKKHPSQDADDWVIISNKRHLLIR